MKEATNLQISGSSTAPGGEYRKVSISGSGHIQGNLRAETLHCSGSGKFEGNVTTTGELFVAGSCQVAGDLVGKNVQIAGSCRVNRKLKAEELHLNGSATVQEGIQCQTLHCAGHLTAQGDVEAEEAELLGGARIDGLLNADTIRIRGKVHVQEIGCSTLVVAQEEAGGWMNRLFGGHDSSSLEAETIEADRADLVNTRADVLRGRDLKIGPGCKIRRAEYSGSCDAAEGTVEELVKV